MLRGAEELKEVCKRRIGQEHAVTADGKFSWEEVECLGACVNAPMIAIHDHYHEDLTPDALEALMDQLARGEKIEPGSAIGRQTSAPEGGAQDADRSERSMTARSPSRSRCLACRRRA